jgi:phosphate transport system substrate-binding protein
VPIAADADGDFVEATPDNSVAGQYPLARFLYVYVNKAPNTPLPPLETEFLKLVLSQSGQEVVIKDGYIPLPGRVVQGMIERLGLE